AADFIKAQAAGDALAVDGVGRTSQGGSAQGQSIYALAAVRQAFGIATEHFGIGQQMMAEGNRLGHLQVGEAGHDGVGVFQRQAGQFTAQLVQQFDGDVDFVAHPQADVSGNLIVARPAGVQPLSGIAYQLDQTLLDIEVDVFKVQRPLEAAVGNFLLYAGHASFDGGKVGGGQDADRGQHV